MSLSSFLPGIDKKVRDRLYFPADVQAAPSRYEGVDFDVVSVEAADQLMIRGLATEIPPSARCCVVFLHGNGGCAATRVHTVAPFFQLGVQVIVADYRGYGGNDGQPSEQGLMHDARAFLKHASKVSDLPIILIGHSLGGNLAIQLAAEHGADIAGMITVNAVASVAAFAPVYVRPFMSDRFDAVRRARKIAIPWTIAHDIGDQVVPFAHSLVLCQANFPNSGMRLITLNNRQHDFDTQSVGTLLLEHLSMISR